MKSDRFKKSLNALTGSFSALFGRRTKTEFSNPRRYRLDFIAENTFNRVWTMRFSRARVFIVTVTIIAAIAALMFVIVFFSPVRKLLPGRLEGDLRSRYVDMALKLDSLERQYRINDLYVDNLKAIFIGDIDPEDAKSELTSDLSKPTPDSLLAASDAERRFVQNFEAAERYNLSVLTPIAAEVMAFYSPVPDALSDPQIDENGFRVTFDEEELLPVSATYRGTVVGCYKGKGNLTTVVIQHPNDFIAIYSGLFDCFVTPGAKVRAGERIGHSGKNNPFSFEMWHNGSATNPTEYIGF